ncbi:hypothetical protein [Methylobacterium marchantiae]|uniref:Uncharacterized protein n=1 Tax=Methylobacterium marchantiae TaxID=600331 RepID=A0ABW3X1R7_9HYPH|nr:hypothetical protein AIGOOFII_3620 [Methylobacterium marchantiae]
MGEMGWYDDVDAPRGRGVMPVLASIRSACRPSNLLPGLLILVGWLAFVGWTGSGSDGWQARVCADLGAHGQSLQARSCGMVPADGAAPVAGERSTS